MSIVHLLEADVGVAIFCHPGGVKPKSERGGYDHVRKRVEVRVKVRMKGKHVHTQSGAGGKDERLVEMRRRECVSGNA